MSTGSNPLDPRRGERRLGVDRRWSRETRDPDRRYGPDDRRAFKRRDRDVPVGRFQRVWRRWFWPNKTTD